METEKEKEEACYRQCANGAKHVDGGGATEGGGGEGGGGLY